MENNEIIKSFNAQATHFSKNKVLSNKSQLENIVELADIKEYEWVLDLGCGTGLLTNAIKEKTNHAVGIDLTEKMLTEATKKNNDLTPTIMYVSGDGHKLPFFDNQFDVVMTRLTIHHFNNPTEILTEVHRVLKDNGRIIIADIVSSDDLDKQEKHNALENVRDPSHIKFFNESELKQLLTECKFTINEVDRWKTSRYLSEWMDITGDISNKKEIIRLLEEGIANDGLGIQVSKKNNELSFNHHWLCLVANK